MDFQLDPTIENLVQLALSREQSGDISGALQLARRALNAAKSKNPPLDYAFALTAVARYRFRLGQYETARKLAQEAMEMTDPHQDAQAAVHCEALLMLGMCALETNSLIECEEFYRNAANLSREIGNSMLFQRAMHNLGSGVYLFHGQFELAIAADSQSLQICREKNYTDWVIFPLITLGIAYQITGKRIDTRDTIAILRAEAQQGSIGEGYACYVSGMLAMDEDDYANAEAELVHAIKIAEVLGDPSLNLDSRLGISRLYRIQGKISKALEWAEDALNFAIRVGYRIYQGRAQVELGRAWWLSHDLVNAENNLLRAEAVFLDMDLRYDLAEVRLVLAALYQQKKDSRVEVLLPQVVNAIQAGGYGFLVERERTLIYTLATSLNGVSGEMTNAVSVLLTILHAVPPKPLKVISLGSLDVWIGAKNVDGRNLRQRRAGELLGLLLSSPEYTLSFEEVAEALCPDKDPQAAENFYHHAISSLRRILEPDLPDRRFPCRYLEVSEERVTIILPPGSKIDFQEFLYSVQEKDWERAISTYRGDYLPMYCYSEWTMSFRRHLADQFEYALLAHATELLDNGDAAGCLLLAQRTFEQNAWQEQAVELGMRAALSLGDRAGALKLYKRLENQLERDLGIAPQNELQRLYNQARKSG